MIFEPLLKEIVWGGQDIEPYKGLEETGRSIGESWEISHVEGNFSVVANGSLRGKNLDELMQEYGDALVGASVRRRFGDTFPLLIKFIDARDNLSIQVHPDDTLARERHNSFGKTEMWYVVKASDEAHLYSGFSSASSPEDYVERVKNNTIMEVLQDYKVSAGDVFFLPAGRVHAIGAGCFVAEIQQTSNVTYRIYDYQRLGMDGKPRELHTELAKDAIDYSLEEDYRTHYEPKLDEAVELVSCPYFETNLLELDRAMDRSHRDLDSFVVYMCLEGKGLLEDESGNKVSFRAGQSILVPREVEQVRLQPEGGRVKLLETYVPREEA